MINKCLVLFNLLPTSQPHHWLIAADWLEEEGLDIIATAFREGVFILEIIDLGGDGDGHGWGYGDGNGWGDGDGHGYGSGDGSGEDNHGNGWGDGDGNGWGDGDGNGWGDGSGGGTGNNTGVA